ncbi:pentapeptide repeat-containing protein [Solwaraspora sp. WMMB335]|uniref:pentapeptide repeat-containing protein n=1 Tax=Solwaraspora sp. WMMB335 TaxID=3404118 RepID=UPI003B94B3EB
MRRGHGLVRDRRHPRPRAHRRRAQLRCGERPAVARCLHHRGPVAGLARDRPAHTLRRGRLHHGHAVGGLFAHRPGGCGTRVRRPWPHLLAGAARRVPAGIARRAIRAAPCQPGTDLGRADFRRADFRRADFRRADFRRADFRRADFRRADQPGRRHVRYRPDRRDGRVRPGDVHLPAPLLRRGGRRSVRRLGRRPGPPTEKTHVAVGGDGCRQHRAPGVDRRRRRHAHAQRRRTGYRHADHDRHPHGGSLGDRTPAEQQTAAAGRGATTAR